MSSSQPSAHVIFLRDGPMNAVLSGEKRYEYRVAVRRLAWADCRKGDLLIFKRTGGGVEATAPCTNAWVWEGMSPERLRALVSKVKDPLGAAYLSAALRYGKAVNVGVFEIGALVPAALPRDLTPSGVREGWVSGFGHADMLTEPETGEVIGSVEEVVELAAEVFGLNLRRPKRPEWVQEAISQDGGA